MGLELELELDLELRFQLETKGPYTQGTRRRNANEQCKMRVTWQQIFSMHNNRNTNVLLKFTQRIKFGAISVTLVKKKIKVQVNKVYTV